MIINNSDWAGSNTNRTKLIEHITGNYSSSEQIIPTAIRTIPTECFRYNTYLTKLIVSNNAIIFLGQSCSDCTSLIEVSGVSGSIHADAQSFANCTSLTTVTMPIRQVYSGAFLNCKLLQNISFTNTITEIGSEAFKNCTSLAITSLPASLLKIKSEAFSGCTSLALTSLPQNLTTLDFAAFKDCSNISLITLPSSLTTIYSSTFFGCTNLALTSLPQNLTKIEIQAFKGCTNLALTSLPQNLTTIESQAFSGCTSLAIDSLPTSLTVLQSQIFEGCTGLTSINLTNVTETQGNTVSVYSYGSFRNCTSLHTVRFGSGITTISRATFGGCTALTKIYIDKPRAQVEAMANYQYAWSSINTTTQTLQPSVIICNDDPNWIPVLRHVEVGDNLNSAKLYFTFPDNLQIPEGFNYVVNTDSSTTSGIETWLIDGTHHVLACNNSIFTGTGSSADLNLTSYTMEADAGTVTQIFTDNPAYQYIWIAE